ncbi:MAG TPA: hypothetical protein VE981_05035, partial [Planctomycetota bacterium]|nr:hypothetical protein [Planctomycetota bacterium]
MRTALALLILLPAPAPREEAPSIRSLKFLARHQRADGSWGAPPPDCRCRFRDVVRTPVDLTPLDEARGLFQAVQEDLSDDDPGIRERARKQLISLGASVIPLLQEAAGAAEPELRWRCRDILATLWRTDAVSRDLFEQGREKEPDLDLALNTTGLILICFMNCGYSQLSRDEYGDAPVDNTRAFKFGEVVKKGLKWLLQQQRDDGSFTAGSSQSNALATLALSEAYGMTAASSLKEPAGQAVAFLKASKPADAATAVWRGLALRSAALGDLIPEKELRPRVEQVADASLPLSPGARLLFSSLARRKAPELVERFLDSDADLLSPEEKL